MIERNWFWVALFPSLFIPAWQICRKALTLSQESELGQVGGPCSRPCGPDLATRKPKVNSQYPVSPSAQEKVSKGKRGDRYSHWGACGNSVIPDKLEPVHAVIKSSTVCDGWRCSVHGSAGSPPWPLTPALPPAFYVPPPHLLPVTPSAGVNNPLATSCFSQVSSAWSKWISESSYKYFGQDMKRQWPLVGMSRRGSGDSSLPGLNPPSSSRRFSKTSGVCRQKEARETYL